MINNIVRWMDNDEGKLVYFIGSSMYLLGFIMAAAICILASIFSSHFAFEIIMIVVLMLNLIKHFFLIKTIRYRWSQRQLEREEVVG